ncbi:MAG: CxxC-x17-CxxC domain-containing protein [Candidatus Bathyarchaeia archaeon]|jgi:CxxC-x17-CxxC domain-containing protein
MSEKVSTQIKCNDCGKTATVNFKPNPNRPVYCRECLAKHKTPRAEPVNRTNIRPTSPDIGNQAWSRRRDNWK